MKKLFQLLLILICLFITVSFLYTKNYEAAVNNESVLESKVRCLDDYTYVRVWENGAWWIYCYDSDGIFVAKIEEH